MRSAMDSNNATIKTLVQQSLDSVNKLSAEMSSVQKSVQEVQANTGARIDTMAQQTQGLSDNLQDVQARVGKLSQQLTDAQNLLQSIDGKLSNQQPGATGLPAHQARREGPQLRMVQEMLLQGTLRREWLQFLGRHALPKRAAGLHEWQVRSGTAGVFRLHQEFSLERSGVQLAVLSGRNCLRPGGFQASDRRV